MRRRHASRVRELRVELTRSQERERVLFRQVQMLEDQVAAVYEPVLAYHVGGVLYHPADVVILRAPS